VAQGRTNSTLSWPGAEQIQPYPGPAQNKFNPILARRRTNSTLSWPGAEQIQPITGPVQNKFNPILARRRTNSTLSWPGAEQIQPCPGPGHGVCLNLLRGSEGLTSHSFSRGNLKNIPTFLVSLSPKQCPCNTYINEMNSSIK
jgi:hypothetical protein